MPPSGDDFILKLLSQSVARLENGGRKRKQKEEEVTLKSIKKVIKDVIATNQSDFIESFVVLQYLKEVSPTLAEEFSDSHILRLISCHLKKVSPGLAEELSSIYEVSKKPYTEVIRRNKKTGTVARRFTPQEDKIIKTAVKDAGEGTIDISLLSKSLNRTTRSVQSRIEILVRVNGNTKKTPFTLLEDVLLLERLVIPRVGSEKLSEIVLQHHQYADLTEQLGKSPISVRHRWETSLQPWLLQHYSGTLNMRVERMLANYIMDTYTDFSSINWPEVAARSDFGGHTKLSLRDLYFRKSEKTRVKFGLESLEVTPEHVAKYCELVYGVGAKGRAKLGASINKSQRQKDVITFFERNVTEFKRKDFV